ncbi:MAG TPA: phytanoyl-CoA dioxygenase family protein [Planctomycetota bacterium]|nr:phytanoyl-CoA dioxygenase family protein [Planctomycetota bacterium]
MNSATTAASPELDRRIVRLSRRYVKLDGVELGLLDANGSPLMDGAELRRNMTRDGYLLVRGLLPAASVLAARRVVLNHLATAGHLDNSRPIDEGILKPGAAGMYLGGRKELTHHPDFTAMAEAPELFGFFDRLFGEASMTFDYKWLRAVGTGEPTPPHYDVVFMGRGTVSKLFTCWVAMGDISLEEGPLAILCGSDSLPSYQKVRETYGRADVDRDSINSNFSYDPLEITSLYGGQWKTATFRTGDCLIFGMHTMHASLRNETQRVRISADLRFQPRSQPVDERWIGANPIANYHWAVYPEKRIPVETSRKEWGV